MSELGRRDPLFSISIWGAIVWATCLVACTSRDPEASAEDESRIHRRHDAAVSDAASADAIAQPDSATASDAAADSGAVGTDAAALDASSAPPDSSAAIQLVQLAAATPQGASANASSAFPGAQQPGDLNIVVVGFSDAANTITSVSDSAGNAYLAAVGPTQGANVTQAIYYAPNIQASASNVVTVAFSGSAAFVDLRILEYRGLNASNSIDQLASASGSGAIAACGSITTSSRDELIFAAGTTLGVFSSPGAGFTQEIITQPDGDIVEDEIASSAGTYAITANQSGSAAYVLQAVAFFGQTSSMPPADAGVAAPDASTPDAAPPAADAATPTPDAGTHLGNGTTYYVAADGSDQNNGTSKSTPWAHLPGMPNCASACAAANPLPGDNFIFRGGDTWGGDSLGIGWGWGGTLADPIYVGVDTSWYSGSAWTRPIWSCGGVPCSANGNFWTTCNSYVTLDNIEMTGLRATAANTGPAYVEACGDHQIYENIYIHGWSRDPDVLTDDAQAFGGNGGYDITGTTFHDNVVDGFDTTQDMLVCFFLAIPTAYNNVCRYMTNGFEASGNDWHDNLVEYLQPCFTASGCHQNFMFQFGPYSGATSYLYNNVIRHSLWVYSGGAPKLWLVGNDSACTGCQTYAFNNIIYDVANAGNYLNICDHPPASDGIFYVYNNTFQVGNDANIESYGLDDAISQAQIMCQINFANNHWIASQPLYGCTAANNCTETNDVVQTLAEANAQGYNDTTEALVFSPTSATGATVGVGVNFSAVCSGGVAALCQDTTYPEYDSVNHRPTLRATAPRPATGPWDVGAYQHGH
jgi:hypothetical protein